MPNRGNSHHWTKNHTATTITNVSRSFIVTLLGLPFFSEHSSPTIRLSGKVPVDERRKFVLCREADEGFPDFSFPDEKQRRYAPDPIIRSGLRGLIHIHLDHFHPAVVLFADFFQNRCIPLFAYSHTPGYGCTIPPVDGLSLIQINDGMELSENT